MTAGDLASRFAHSWPTTTRHLGVLRDAGLIRVERHGRERHYHLDRTHLRSVTDLWLSAVDLHVDDRWRAAGGQRWRVSGVSGVGGVAGRAPGDLT